MYTLHCTKKLLDRVRVPAASSLRPPTTVLGNWYATALFWKPQVALFVNERTLLPMLMRLAPVSVIQRFPSELATPLARHGGNQAFIATEVAGMSEVSIAKTAKPERGRHDERGVVPEKRSLTDTSGTRLFPLAHGLSRSWQLIRGRGSYWNNHFEVQARRLSSCATQR